MNARRVGGQACKELQTGFDRVVDPIDDLTREHRVRGKVLERAAAEAWGWTA